MGVDHPWGQIEVEAPPYLGTSQDVDGYGGGKGFCPAFWKVMSYCPRSSRHLGGIKKGQRREAE